jgi:hypothetical protein
MHSEPATGNSAHSLALIRPTMGQVFGIRGGVRFRNEGGRDGSEMARAGMSDSEYEEMIANLNYEFERRILRGPSDDGKELPKGPELSAADRPGEPREPRRMGAEDQTHARREPPVGDTGASAISWPPAKSCTSGATFSLAAPCSSQGWTSAL